MGTSDEVSKSHAEGFRYPPPSAVDVSKKWIKNKIVTGV